MRAPPGSLLLVSFRFGEEMEVSFSQPVMGKSSESERATCASWSVSATAAFMTATVDEAVNGEYASVAVPPGECSSDTGARGLCGVAGGAACRPSRKENPGAR